MTSDEEMRRGPYRGRAMTSLTEADLGCLGAWAGAELTGLTNGDGHCEYRRYQGLKWSQVREQDRDYYRWAERDYYETVRNVEALLAHRGEERARRQQEWEHQERLAAAAAGGEPLFTPEEQRAIASGDLLEVIEACYLAGYRQLVRTHHPDRPDGDAEFMVRLNQAEPVFRKLLAALRKELDELDGDD